MIQVIHQPNVWESMGKLLGGVVLPKVYENYNAREAKKQGYYMKAQDATDNIYQQLKAYTNTQNLYNNAKNADSSEFTALADKYNNPATSDEEKAQLASQMNAIGAQVLPGVAQNTSGYWTNVKDAINNGSSAKLKGLRNNYLNAAMTIDPSIDTKSSTWGTDAYNKLQNDYQLASGYKDSQKGNTVSSGSFKPFYQYWNEAHNPTPVQDNTLAYGKPMNLQSTSTPANVITLGQANPMNWNYSDDLKQFVSQ